ncbi:hypothetical protein [Paenibacillus sp. USDA918EY]|uniref:hypothetical protein n=1 Tax=Paenibacillus sp. USDA918EY TaxID=2689575 RepID=UPI00135CA680|nr:hypothetical protein [Paenibacillus sp. USDA918EY]
MDKEIAAARQALQHVPIMEGRIIGGALGKLDRALKEKDAEIESLKQQLRRQNELGVEWMLDYYAMSSRFQELKKELAVARREIDWLREVPHAGQGS